MRRGFIILFIVLLSAAAYFAISSYRRAGGKGSFLTFVYQEIAQTFTDVKQEVQTLPEGTAYSVKTPEALQLQLMNSATKAIEIDEIWRGEYAASLSEISDMPTPPPDIVYFYERTEKGYIFELRSKTTKKTLQRVEKK